MYPSAPMDSVSHPRIMVPLGRGSQTDEDLAGIVPHEAKKRTRLLLAIWHGPNPDLLLAETTLDRGRLMRTTCIHRLT